MFLTNITVWQGLYVVITERSNCNKLFVSLFKPFSSLYMSDNWCLELECFLATENRAGHARISSGTLNPTGNTGYM